MRAILRVGNATYVAVNDFVGTGSDAPSTSSTTTTTTVTSSSSSAPAKGTRISLGGGGTTAATPSGGRGGAARGRGAVYRLDDAGGIEQVFALSDGYLTALLADGNERAGRGRNPGQGLPAAARPDVRPGRRPVGTAGADAAAGGRRLPGRHRRRRRRLRGAPGGPGRRQLPVEGVRRRLLHPLGTAALDGQPQACSSRPDRATPPSPIAAGPPGRSWSRSAGPAPTARARSPASPAATSSTRWRCPTRAAP